MKRNKERKRPPTLKRGKRLSYNASIQSWYNSSLQKLINTMTKEVQKEVIKLFKRVPVKPFATDESLGSQARILMNALLSKFTSIFAIESQSLSKAMIDRTLKYGKTSVEASLKDLSGGITIKTSLVPPELVDVVAATIAENVSLIKSIPAQYFKDVTGSVMRSITSGEGMYDLLPQIKKYGTMTGRRAELLALDQTRKAYTSVNVAKLEKAGVTKFEWLHSGGGRDPRESHLKMDGHIFTFANLQEEQAAMGVPKEDRGLPGYPINCKCTMAAVEEYEDEE